MLTLPSLKKAKIENKTVLLRADFDVPLQLSAEGRWAVADDFRLHRAMPTIKFLLEKNCKIIIIAHLGRPKTWDEKKSLRPAAERISEILKHKFMALDKSTERLPHYQMPHVFFYRDDFHQPALARFIADANAKDILVLENLRFYPGEDSGSTAFARELSSLAEIFVSDAFASSYDDRASLTLIPKYLPRFAGIELEKEITLLSQIVLKPSRPYVVMVGGIKLSDKLAGLTGMLERADEVVVGGGLASLFFLSLGYDVGQSLIEKKSLQAAGQLLRNYREKFFLPVDVVVARSAEQPETLRVATPDKIGPAETILDVGPATIKKFSQILRTGKTIVWSGPMGKFEIPQFSHGTKALGMLAATLASSQAFVIAGGGDTLEAIKLLKVGDYFDFLSTGGSAMLLYLSGEKLPGIEALKM